MKNPNGYGSVIKLAGNRRKPWACRLTMGFKTNEDTHKAYPIYRYISYHATRIEAVKALADYNNNPYELNSLTFEDVFEKWQGQLSPNKQVERRNRNIFSKLEVLHKKKFSTLRMSDWQLCIDDLELTQSICNNIRTLMNGVYGYAVKRNMCPLSSLEMVKLVDIVPNVETKKVDRRVFAKNEIDLLWANKDDAVVRQILVYIYTGMRFVELHTVPDDCIHDNYIDLPKTKTDAGARTVPLSDKVLSLLPIDRIPPYSTFYVQFVDVMNRFGMKHTIHDTRHTFVSLMTEAGTDARLLKKIVGHTTNDVTEDVYTHISLEAMLEAVNKI